MTSAQKAESVITIVKAVGDAIKEAGAIPSGHLYSILMQQGCSPQSYNLLIDTFKKAGKVKEANNLLYWID